MPNKKLNLTAASTYVVSEEALRRVSIANRVAESVPWANTYLVVGMLEQFKYNEQCFINILRGWRMLGRRREFGRGGARGSERGGERVRERGGERVRERGERVRERQEERDLERRAEHIVVRGLMDEERRAERRGREEGDRHNEHYYNRHNGGNQNDDLEDGESN
ncbi:centrosome and spindle pole associated protein 1-like [Macrosteles quadrilineatus]|uniref:centrosome and spindle pole associated protein 1-like n=1 Tax=Macrosteles quadrilineatus TaxID=74068 RepID=UPI0023E31CBF|nr:centrosome and spindle pole associated protein 1-like [Macrosteles quadrilineatus]